MLKQAETLVVDLSAMPFPGVDSSSGSAQPWPNLPAQMSGSYFCPSSGMSVFRNVYVLNRVEFCFKDLKGLKFVPRKPSMTVSKYSFDRDGATAEDLQSLAVSVDGNNKAYLSISQLMSFLQLCRLRSEDPDFKGKE